MSIPGFNLNWVYTAISWVMLEWHALFSTFLDKDAGITWALSIVFLVITARLLLFRFFIKQVQVPARDAGDAAEDPEAAGEVQERPAELQPGDDGAAEGARASTRWPAACRSSCRSRSSSRCSTCCG